MFNLITNLFKKSKYKNEVSLIRVKLEFLSQEAISNRATKADVPFWDTLLGRLDEINKECNNVNGSKELYDYYLNIYKKYVNKGE